MSDWNDVGSGNPYAGSGFVNFDRFMQPENIAWGANQEGTWNKDQATWNYDSPQTDWSLKSPYDEWMINAGQKPYVEPPPQEAPPQEAPPEENPLSEVPEKPESRLPGRKQDDLARYDPRNPDHYPEGDAFPSLNRYLGGGY